MKYRACLLPAIVLAVIISAANAAPPESRPSVATTDATRIADNDTYINANKILMFVTNHGSLGWDISDVFGFDFGTFYPYTSIEDILAGVTATPLYAAGPWLGGRVDGDLRMAISEYWDEFCPGPMAGGTWQPDNPSFRVYKLYRDSMADNPNTDFLEWPVGQGAPVDDQGLPRLRGDQTLWAVFNDANPSIHWADPGMTDPMGLQVNLTVWSSDEAGSIEIPGPIELPVEHIGDSPGWVTVDIIDPAGVNGHQYAVTFEPDPDNGSTWNLVDMTLGTIVLNGQTNQSGLQNLEIEGLRLNVFGGDLGVKPLDEGLTSDSALWGWMIPNGERRFTWENADGFRWEGFRGALGWGGPGDTHGFGWYEPVPVADLKEVLLKLAPVMADGTFDPSHEDVSYGYRYMRGSGVPAQPEFEPYIIDPWAGSYGFQAFEKNVPLSAWDISSDPPRRLVVGFIENNVVGGLVDGKYWPPYFEDADNVTSTGPREWLWIYLADYTEIPNPDFQGNAIDDPMPIMYWATWARADTDDWQGGDEFLIIPGTQYYTTPADTFLFVADPPETHHVGSEALSIYIEYKILNKGGNNIEDMYVGFWSDPDLGYSVDDFVGCDTMLDAFFCYNAEANDLEYGSQPPAIGFRFLCGPLAPSPGDTGYFDGEPRPGYRNLGLTSFHRFVGGTDPNNAVETYNYMQGFDVFGDPLPNGTTYDFPGDPVTGTGDLDIDAAERRMLGVSGPVDLPPGDSQYILIKMAVAQGSDYLHAITVMKEILALGLPEGPTGVIACHNPVIFNVFMLNALEPITGVYTVGYAAPGPAGKDIDFSSVTFSGLPTIDSMSTTGFESGFDGTVGHYYFALEDLLAPHAGLWDSVVVPNTISGTYLDGEPFGFNADIVIYGRIPGDFNLDGQVDISDLVATIEYFFEEGPAPVQPEAIDLDHNGEGDISDLMLLIEYMF